MISFSNSLTERQAESNSLTQVRFMSTLSLNSPEKRSVSLPKQRCWSSSVVNSCNTVVSHITTNSGKSVLVDIILYSKWCCDLYVLTFKYVSPFTPAASHSNCRFSDMNANCSLKDLLLPVRVKEHLCLVASMTCGDMSDIQNITSTLTVHLLRTSSGLHIAEHFHDFTNNQYAHMANIR